MSEHASARQTRAPLMAWANLLLTALRYQAAVIATAGQSTAPLARFRATEPGAVFTIVGAGGTVNDLTSAYRAQIAGGVCASINMAALAPMDFDICSTEAFVAQTDLEAFLAALREKSRVPLIWHQNRARHENALIARLEAEVGLYRYRRASVSVHGDVRNFELAFRRFVAPRVFGRPNLRVCFALTGSVARLVLLAASLGYRHIRFVGVDLGSTPYFWLEQPGASTPALSADYQTTSLGATRQGAGGVVPDFFQFIREIKSHQPDLDLATFDPKGRSRLTPFLKALRR